MRMVLFLNQMHQDREEVLGRLSRAIDEAFKAPKLEVP
jgi:hypothetical protein